MRISRKQEFEYRYGLHVLQLGVLHIICFSVIVIKDGAKVTQFSYPFLIRTALHLSSTTLYSEATF